MCLQIEEPPTVADAGPASWAPSAGADLSPASTAIPLDVVEQACASGRSADGRVVVRDIAYESDAILVDIGVIPIPGGSTCPGNPITPFTLELDEPLGDRQLLDGAADPPAPPQLSQ